MRIELWGRMGVGWRHDGWKLEGKGKEREVDGGSRDDVEWTVLEEWNVDLAHWVPLPDEVRGCPSISDVLMRGSW